MITAIAQSSHPLPSSGMSNSDSPPNSPEKLPLTRKRSAVLKKVKGNWCDGESSEKTSVDEKNISELKLPLFAFEMHSFVENDDGIAYKAFLKAYPEYRLTWIIDKLRQTDFARLDRTGETYVDYMGGAMYPESLIRAHTMFLNQNVLGNTHSVSNRYVNKMFARTTYWTTLSIARSFHQRTPTKRATPFFPSFAHLQDTRSYSQQTRLALWSLLANRFRLTIEAPTYWVRIRTTLFMG